MHCFDAHHHLWRYSAAEYGWINERMSPLRRDFLPAHLRAEMEAANISQCLAVQARQTLEETEWLLDLAEENHEIAGVIGWAPIASAEFPALLDSLAARPHLKGLRHILQDEADPRYALSDEFTQGLRCFQSRGMVYEILLYAHQLPVALALVDQHPQQSFVLDHLGKPSIACAQSKPEEINHWRKHLDALAKRSQVSCKLSGLATEANWDCWSLDLLRPYLDAALESFGPDRLMAGSDWPVCTLATSYQRWWQTLRDWCSPLSASEQKKILCENAMRIYNLDPHNLELYRLDRKLDHNLDRNLAPDSPLQSNNPASETLP